MRQHSRKIYYSAGLISIILLPIFCVLYLKDNGAFKNNSSIKVFFWNGKENQSGERGIKKFLNSKKFILVNLTGNNNSDKAKLEIAQKNVRKLIASKDSINGVKFHFEKKSEYWTLIKALEILTIEKAKCYIPYKNDIWVMNPKVRNKNLPKLKIMSCGTRSSTIIIQNESKTKWKKIKEVVTKYYLSTFVYFLMIIFTLKRYCK